MLFKVICLKKHLPPGLFHHVKNWIAWKMVVSPGPSTKWDLASSQLGRETCKEKAGALGSAAYKLADDAFCLV